MSRCKTEQDCTHLPWCRINGWCHQDHLNAAPQGPAMETSGVGAAEVDSRSSKDLNSVESATSVHVPIASPAVAAPSTRAKV